MNNELDHDALAARWLANERELNRIAAASGLDREMCAVEVDRLEAEQDRIEFLIGWESHILSGSRPIG